MSLLDTLPSSAALDEELLELDLDFEPCDPCLALQRASCVDDVDVDIDIIDEEPAVADAAHPAPVRPPRARRRRRTDAVEHAPVRSRAEICTAAAKARWAKRRKKDEPEEAVGVAAAASSEASSEAIVVWSGEHGDGLNRDSTLAVLSTLPLPVPSSTDATKELFQKMGNVMSRTALGSQLKMSDRTVQHRMRKMASSCLLPLVCGCGKLYGHCMSIYEHSTATTLRSCIWLRRGSTNLASGCELGAEMMATVKSHVGGGMMTPSWPS